MAFQRRILHHGPDPLATPQLLSLTAVRSCWFELHRQGGCGAAQLILSDDFAQRNEIELGDWISFETVAGERWYLGRVEERSAEVPARIRFRLQGMGVELNEVFPGGFGSEADGRNPHRYGGSDLFSLDPDRQWETNDVAASADAVVRLLLTQYLPAGSHIQYVADLIESPAQSATVTTLKVRGEESLHSILKDLALRAQSAAWGVDALGRFFFLRPRQEVLLTLREQRDLTALAETQDFEYLFNRLLLTGDYVYDQPLTSGDLARRIYRWRGNYFEPNSRSQYGERRLRIWVPWIRTQSDSLAFVREFFRTYSQPGSRYLLETTPQLTLPWPWWGRVRLESATGEELTTSRVETLRVLFDHAPRFRVELGPEDPRTLWPEPPQDERWELPNQVVKAGGGVSLPPTLAAPGGGGGTTHSGTSSAVDSSARSSLSQPASTGSGEPSGTVSEGSSPMWFSSNSSGFHASSESSSGRGAGSESVGLPNSSASSIWIGSHSSSDSWNGFPSSASSEHESSAGPSSRASSQQTAPEGSIESFDSADNGSSSTFFSHSSADNSIPLRSSHLPTNSAWESMSDSGAGTEGDSRSEGGSATESGSVFGSTSLPPSAAGASSGNESSLPPVSARDSSMQWSSLGVSSDGVDSVVASESGSGGVSAGGGSSGGGSLDGGSLDGGGSAVEGSSAGGAASADDSDGGSGPHGGGSAGGGSAGGVQSGAGDGSIADSETLSSLSSDEQTSSEFLSSSNSSDFDSSQRHDPWSLTDWL